MYVIKLRRQLSPLQYILRDPKWPSITPSRRQAHPVFPASPTRTDTAHTETCQTPSEPHFELEGRGGSDMVAVCGEFEFNAIAGV